MRTLTFLAVVVLSAGCGGATETDLLGTAPATSGTDASTKDTGTIGVDVSVPPSDAGADDVSVVSDTSVVDVSVPDDVSVPPSDPGIWCGTDKNQTDVFCANTTQICCYQKFSVNPTYTCKAGGSLNPCVGGTVVSCDDEADCNGKVCCGGFLTNAYDEVSCKATCTGVVNGRLQVRFCDPNAPQDECASLGQSCQASGTLDGFFVCK